MIPGQVSIGSPFDAASQPAPRASVPDPLGQAAFAQLFEAALALSGEPGADTDTAGNVDDGLSGFGSLLSAASAGLPGEVSFADSSFPGAMQRILSRAAAAQIGGSAADANGGSPSLSDHPAAGIAAAQPIDGAVPSSAWPGTPVATTTPGSAVDKNQLSEWMDAHALTRSSHHCAMYCRMGLQAAGLDTSDRPQSGDAGDYGPYLLRHGAQVVSPASYVPQVGDVVVFDKTARHPSGHIEMYDGKRWVSDFRQNSFSPYRDLSSTPPFTIYRLT